MTDAESEVIKAKLLVVVTGIPAPCKVIAVDRELKTENWR